MISKKIVITGAPGTGKSSIIHELEAAGFHCFHEVIRSMTLQAKKEGNPDTIMTNPLAFVSDPEQFNRQLLKERLKHYRDGGGVIQPLVFYDRGLPDILAYMDYFSQKYGAEFEAACEKNRYDKVLLLPPWEEIYISDNERMESFEESLEIHQHLTETYVRYGYTPSIVPEGTIQERAAHILSELIREKYL